MFGGFMINTDFVTFLMPEIVLTVGVLLLLVLTSLKYVKLPEENNALQVVAMLFTVVPLLLLMNNFKTFVEAYPNLMMLLSSPWQNDAIYQLPQAQTYLFGSLREDVMGYFVRALLLMGLSLVITFSGPYLSKRTAIIGDFYLLVMGATLGGLVLTTANDFILLFVALETLSITSYILTGFLRRDQLSAEASFKYLVYGGVATGVFLFGASLVYGLVGSTNLTDIANVLHPLGGQTHPTLVLMLVMMLSAVMFKLSIAPFQMWTPDVYEGSPTPVAGFLSVVSKTAAFALAIRLLMFVFFDFYAIWQPLLMVVAVLSMIIGNVVALRQTSMKRMLAYSTIAQAGYMLLGLLVLTSEGVSTTLFYLLAYLFMNLGAFAAVLYIENHLGTDNMQAFSGLSRKLPGLSLGLTVCLLSLAGIPITAGFFAKFFLFQSVVMAGTEYMGLVIIALLTSTVSLYYYLNPIRLMVVGEPSQAVERLEINSEAPLPLTVATIATIALGVWASVFLNVTQVAALQVVAAIPGFAELSQAPTVDQTQP